MRGLPKPKPKPNYIYSSDSEQFISLM